MFNEKIKNEHLNRLSSEDFKTKEKLPVIVVLDNIRSLNNIGSVFRTADAFLIEQIILCGLCGTPPNKEIEKTALGATSTVGWSYFSSTVEAIKDLKNRNYHIVSIEQVENKTWLQNFHLNDKKIALIFGNEVYGVDQSVIDLSDEVVEIPQLGTKHSLNISVSVGIVLWEIVRTKI
ncbi:MAG: RNA methyltransferase [Bacteroidetes bacterium]|nr:RNA methyltransferase [Bacteroidota bacterium]MCA6443756.1 RNA methyltransferase [Bacteroidota bacterium]